MNLLDSLNSFIRVVETSSFSAVARETGTSQSAVTRQITQLEEHFGVRLLHRTTRRLSLTDDGHLLVGYARQLIHDASAMERELGQHRTAPVGIVRLGTAIGPGLFLAPRLPTLLQRHPGLSVEVVISDRPCDMIESRLDLALHNASIADSSLITRQIGVFGRCVVAAPHYLEQFGKPAVPAELAHHVCIPQDDGTDTGLWNFSGPEGTLSVRVSGPLSTNNERAALLMARSGCGIACLSEMQVIDDVRSGRLERLMPGYESEPMVMRIAYPSRRHLALRTRVVLDFVVESIRNGTRDTENGADDVTYLAATSGLRAASQNRLAA